MCSCNKQHIPCTNFCGCVDDYCENPSNVLFREKNQEEFDESDNSESEMEDQDSEL